MAIPWNGGYLRRTKGFGLNKDEDEKGNGKFSHEDFFIC